MCKGSPRYLQGNDPCLPWKVAVICNISISLHLIAKSSDFWRFVFTPVAFPKTSRMHHTCPTSVIVGLTNKAAASAYRLVLNFIGSAPMGFRIPACVALSKMRCRGSIARMNNIGDRGSPSRRPRRCLIGLPGIPLRRIRDIVLPHRREMMSRNRCPNPSFCNTSSM